MSGGHFSYTNDNAANEIFDWLSPDYGERGFRKSKQAARWNLHSEDVDEIFRHYAGPYTDRAIVGYVFPNIDELAREEVYSLGWVRDGEGAERYFDFEKFAKDLLEDETVVELEDGRVVTLNL